MAAASPMRTPTSGRAHQALRAHRPDHTCQNSAYAATMKNATKMSFMLIRLITKLIPSIATNAAARTAIRRRLNIVAASR